MAMVGGTGQVREADNDVQAVCDEMKAEILQKAGKVEGDIDMFKAINYKTQVVAGRNLFVKIQVHSKGEYVHARIFEHLPCNVQDGGKSAEVTSVQKDKKLADPVEYF